MTESDELMKKASDKGALWKIVLIDDDFQVLRGLNKVIPWEELGAAFAGEAISGEAGLELVEREQPDIVITDLYMPGMNGIDMIEKLRRRGYRGSVIILSGYSDFEYARKALRMNVSDYISKPVTVQQLREVLIRVIERIEDDILDKLERSELKKSLASYESVLMEEWLYSVISGTRSETIRTWHDANSPEQRWMGKQHRIMVIELIRNERISGVSAGDLNLFKFAVSNVTRELLSIHWPDAHFLQLYGYHFSILLHQDSGEDLLTQTEMLALRISESLSQYLNVKVRIGIGGLKMQEYDICQSTDEAFQALLKGQFAWEQEESFYVFQHDGSNVEEADQAREVSRNGDSNSLPSSFGFYQRLSTAMSHYSEEKIINEIRSYFQALEQSSGKLTEMFYRVSAAEIWALFHYSLHQSGAGVLAELDRTSLAEYDDIANWEQLERWIEPKVKLYCSMKVPSLNSKHKQAIDFMIEYIHENYNKDITLDELANQLYISKNYLNQLFKKVTGDTFMNYVIRVRMQKAKSLLIEGKYLVYEIAEMVGYQNVPYFSTLFKKHCGVNPSELAKGLNGQ